MCLNLGMMCKWFLWSPVALHLCDNKSQQTDQAKGKLQNHSSSLGDRFGDEEAVTMVDMLIRVTAGHQSVGYPPPSQKSASDRPLHSRGIKEPGRVPSAQRPGLHSYQQP